MTGFINEQEASVYPKDLSLERKENTNSVNEGQVSSFSILKNVIAYQKKKMFFLSLES